jgi:hypothetical protein
MADPIAMPDVKIVDWTFDYIDPAQVARMESRRTEVEYVYAGYWQASYVFEPKTIW